MITSTSSHLGLKLNRLLIIAMITLVSACTPSKDNSSKVTNESDQPVKVKLASQQNKVVYGEDTRQDVYEVLDEELQQRARRSIVAMFNSSDLSINSSTGVVTPEGSSLGSRYRLCDGQRYGNQISASGCSATLIDDDVIVTAGHCVESQAECDSKRFVFGYYMQDSNTLAPINTNQVFSCERLLSNINRFPLDYAFIKLDRAVDPSVGEPAPVTQTATPVLLNSPVVMMGFPSGLPLKVDAGGFVSDPRGASPPLNYFRATVDAFGGNSGSGVFNSSGEQVGILVRGETDYVSSSQRCTVVNELNLDRGPGEEAEEITYLSRALSALCDSGYPSERLCGQSLGGLCGECEQNTDCQDGLQCGRFQAYPNTPSFCAPACTLDDNCPQNHQCIQGQCTPIEVRSCFENQIIVDDACGRRLGVEELCVGAELCRRGSCVPAAAGDICETAIQLTNENQVIQGTLADGFSSSTFGSCGGEGPEAFYRFDLAQANRLIASSTGFDTVLHLRTGCELTDEIACVDDSRPPGRYGSQIDIRLDAGTYYLAMDSFNPEENNNYELSIELCEQVCLLGEQRCDGEGRVERCDINAEGCASWQGGEDCGARAVCSEGRCVLPEIGDDCENSEVIEFTDIPQSQSYEGQINEQYSLKLGSQCFPDANYDRFYSFEIERASIVNAELITDTDAALALYSGCPSADSDTTELTCVLKLSDMATLEESLAPGSYTLVLISETTLEYTLNVSIAPDCEDECDLNTEPYCDAEIQDNGLSVEVIRECQVSFEGCNKLVIVDECNGRVCADGECMEECMNSCELGEYTCLDQSTVITCVADERACTFWSESNNCNTDELCLEGRCVPEGPDEGQAGDEAIEQSDQGLPAVDESREKWASYSGPKDVELPMRSRGGCEQKSLVLLDPAYLFLVGLFLWRRRLGKITGSEEAI